MDNLLRKNTRLILLFFFHIVLTSQAMGNGDDTSRKKTETQILAEELSKSAIEKGLTYDPKIIDSMGAGKEGDYNGLEKFYPAENFIPEKTQTNKDEETKLWIGIIGGTSVIILLVSSAFLSTKGTRKKQ